MMPDVFLSGIDVAVWAVGEGAAVGAGRHHVAFHGDVPVLTPVAKARLVH